MSERYFGDVLGSYANGVQLDLRVKLAVDFLKSPWAAQWSDSEALAAAALQLASELLSQSQALGLMAELPDSDQLSAPMRRHIRRQVRAQVVGQIAAQEIGAEEAPKVQPMGGARDFVRQQ